jgi:hypothetical protein
MISLAETSIALRGVSRILRFDPDFIRYFDRSRDGALRSFWMAAPSVLVFLAQLYIQVSPDTPPIGGRMLTAMLLAFAVNCMTFPLVLLSIAPMIGRKPQAVGCITVYNWTTSLLYILLSVPMILLSLTGLSDSIQVWLSYAILLISLTCEGFVLAVTLQIRGLAAASLVALDYVLTQLIYGIAGQLGIHPAF